MQPYADPFLRFAHAAARRRPGTEVFTIGTRLTRVTREMRGRDPSAALVAVSGAVPDWSGGTRLGELVQGVPRPVGPARAGPRRGRGGRVRRLGARRRRRCSASRWRGCAGWRTGWCGSTRTAAQPGYAPMTAGMAAALPHVDDFVDGHTLAALERLAGAARPEGSAVHDVVDEVARLVRRRASGSRWRPSSGPGAARPRQPGAAMVVAADGEPTGSVSRRLRRGRGLRARPGGDGQRRAGAAAVRRQRRRRVRGRADLRRDHRHLRRAGRPGDVPRAAGGGRVDRGARAGRGRDGRRRARATSARTWWCGRTASAGALGHARGSTHAVADDVRGMLDHGADRRAAHRPGRRAPPGRAQRLRAVVRAAAADARLRRHRLRRGGGPGRQVPRLPRHGLRRPRRCSRRRKRFPEADEVVVEWPHRYLGDHRRSTRAP